MKFGFRSPSLKKSFKASTSRSLKRAFKSTFIPAYGRKGMGYVNNPKKALYNKLYSNTTVSVFDSLPSEARQRDIENMSIPKDRIKYSGITYFLALVSTGLAISLWIRDFTMPGFILFNLSWVFLVFFGFRDFLDYRKEASLEKARLRSVLLDLSDDISQEDLDELSLNELSFFTYNMAIELVNRFNQLVVTINTSVNIEEYFKAWTDMKNVVDNMEKLHDQIEILCADCDDPIYMRNNFDFEKNRHNKVFVDKMIELTMEDAKELKTQRGRANRLEKMFDCLMDNKCYMDDDLIKYISFQRITSDIE